MKKIIVLTVTILLISTPTMAATKGQQHCTRVTFGQRWLYNICMTKNFGTGDFIDHGAFFWRH